MASEERDGRALLAGLTVLALLLGSAWWRSAAPQPGPATSAAPASADLAPRNWRVDPSTGEARPVPRPGRDAVSDIRRVPRAEPGRSVVIQVEDDGTTHVLQVSHVVWRERSRLTPGGPPVVRQVRPTRGDNYRLSVSCAGDGVVVVLVSGLGDDDLRRALRCGGQLDVPVVGGRDELVQMRFVAIRGRAELDARLEALY
ncbi:hypothetical protein [Micromonospora chalcea]|uniref:hypothetical protein n=1 Tax=Micromonospora chalcea TaxID=1874 RepID=UPI00157D035C|nr:hypothetical protein [Micromonospora chalcea]